MSAKDMTDDERRYLHERGSVAELELVEWELDDLNAAERLSMERRRAFLRTFAVRGIIGEGCKVAGVSRSTVQGWRETSEWFEELYQAALEEAADRIEAEAIRRAVDGYDEPVIYQGMITEVQDAETGERRALTVRKYSDTLMQMVLKGARPEKYRDNHKVEHEFGAGGVLMVPGPIDPDTWAKAAREQQSKYAGNAGSKPDDTTAK